VNVITKKAGINQSIIVIGHDKDLLGSMFFIHLKYKANISSTITMRTGQPISGG